MKENDKVYFLTLIKRIANKNGKIAHWICKCDCGNEKIIAEPHLYGKRCIKSCGCHAYKNKSFLHEENYNEIMKNKIQNNIKINEKGCWLWQGAKHRQGYGHISFNRKVQLCHRVVWILWKGNISEKVKVCHKCDITCCCNPEHLFLGSQQDNIHDAISKKKFENRKMGKRRNKLNFEQVQEVKSLHAKGISRKELQRMFSVGETCIAKILTGVSWNVNWTKE